MDPSPPPPPPPPREGPSGASTQATACYRHPDRPTRLSCSSCGRPICVDCTRQSAVGQKCPECAAPSGRNRVVTASQIRNRSALDGAPVTKGILAVTVVIGVLGFLRLGVWGELASLLIHDVAAVDAGEVWRAVSSALLHAPGSLFHIGFNMWALFVFGPDLERRFGSLPFALFYVAAAAGGGLAFQIARDGGSALGASGAIFGLFGAYVTAAYLSRQTAAGRAGLNQLLPLLVINLALPLFIPNIAWEAHVGGLVVGAAMMAGWRRVGGRAGRTGQPDRSSGATTGRALIAGAVLVLCLAVLVVL